MRVKGARIFLLRREKLVGSFIKLFGYMKCYCMETGDQLFSLLLRGEQKEMVFNFSRGELGWIQGNISPKWGLLSIGMDYHEISFWRCLQITETDVGGMVWRGGVLPKALENQPDDLPLAGPYAKPAGPPSDKVWRSARLILAFDCFSGCWARVHTATGLVFLVSNYYLVGSSDWARSGRR